MLTCFNVLLDKSKYYKIIKPYVFSTIYKRQNAKEILKSKICLYCLSKGNKDQDSIRTYEIPYMGGSLVSERTKFHLNTYKEGKEVFFLVTNVNL